MSLSVALTKGRLEKSTVEMLSQCGYGVDGLIHKNRELVIADTVKDVRYFLVKSNDCITYVEHGVADIGIVGKDTLMEGGKDYYEMLDLECGKCRFVVAGLKDCNPLSKVGHIKIGTKYPKVTTEYFSRKGLDVEIIKIDGSVELSPLLGLCDGIVDIMETGTTLKENGLVVYDIVAEISARVIVNKVSFKMKKKEVMAFLNDLERIVRKNA
ncbi:MAG: ATP phosphoribosyltransferase [Solobacterium sp.]|nr:ATP phosphoribosyltransferase [Solobacterium sp.]